MSYLSNSSWWWETGLDGIGSSLIVAMLAFVGIWLTVQAERNRANGDRLTGRLENVYFALGKIDFDPELFDISMLHTDGPTKNRKIVDLLMNLNALVTATERARERQLAKVFHGHADRIRGFCTFGASSAAVAEEFTRLEGDVAYCLIDLTGARHALPQELATHDDH